MIKNQALFKSNRGMLFLALLLGAIAAILVVVYVQSAAEESGGAGGGPSGQVVVAKNDIAPGTRITAEMVTVKTVPVDLQIVGVFTRADDVVGKVTQVPVIAGEQLSGPKITATGPSIAQFQENPPLSLVIPEGMRAFSLEVEEQRAVGGLIRTGDFVDVMMPAGPASCYVVQNIQVVAVAQAVSTVPLTGTDNNQNRTSQIGDETKPDAKSVTLAVTPAQALQLLRAVQASEDNVLWLALRAFSDHGGANVPQCAL
ncbi:MAG TPA: Flp pilus assembly protein CpaB [Dehalococcoidia bacterium]|nr:Flp pilus assembly protein CpaB [Dehalococcoidia bacterium]